MPSFSSWNGAKLHGHEYLLTDVLKEELGFPGFVISDWAGIDQLPGDYASDVRDRDQRRHRHGHGAGRLPAVREHAAAEVEAGAIPIARVDDAVAKILAAKFELGLFERPYADRASIADVGSADHREAGTAGGARVARPAEERRRPAAAEVGVGIYVAGVNADDIGNQCGGWTIRWQGCSGEITPGTTILEGITASVDADRSVIFDRRAEDIRGDIGVVVVGEQPYAEGRGDDRGPLPQHR